MSEMTATFYDRLELLGAQFNPHVLEQTRALVKELPRTHTDAPVDVVTLSYGAHDRQRFDLYSSGTASKGLLAFVPGGGFVGGNRLGYREFGEHVARQGFAVAIADYRLAPDAPWPAGAEDIGSFLTALAETGHSRSWYGTRFTLVGHSAGATHVASAAFDSRFNAPVKKHIDRLVLVSGLYQFPYIGMSDNVCAYIGVDEATYADRSPLTHISTNLCPMLIMVAELDPAPFLASALALSARLQAVGASSPRLLVAARHNHISQILGVGTACDPLTSGLTRFVSSTA